MSPFGYLYDARKEKFIHFLVASAGKFLYIIIVKKKKWYATKNDEKHRIRYRRRIP